mgnify:CR=1 FL=1
MSDPEVRILIVDDSASIGQMLQAGLELHGFTAKYEPRSIDAIRTCLEFHPDLVLLDVEMPIKDGGQLAADLQSHPKLRHIPVIFLTSLVTKEEANQNGSGSMFLSKPIPVAELVARIRSVLQPQPQP